MQGSRASFLGVSLEKGCATKEAKSIFKCNKGKKVKPSTRLVPDIIGDVVAYETSKLCKPWGKVRDQHALIIYDSRARANFITPDLARTSRIRSKEMGNVHESALATSGHNDIP